MPIVVTLKLDLFRAQLRRVLGQLDAGDVLLARAVLPTLGGVAFVEALKIVIELGVSGFDELAQGRPREIAVLIVNCLDLRAIHRDEVSLDEVERIAISNLTPALLGIIEAEIITPA
jgi:hypothetical protein